MAGTYASCGSTAGWPAHTAPPGAGFPIPSAGANPSPQSEPQRKAQSAPTPPSPPQPPACTPHRKRPRSGNQRPLASLLRIGVGRARLLLLQRYGLLVGIGQIGNLDAKGRDRPDAEAPRHNIPRRSQVNIIAGKQKRLLGPV